MHDKLFTQRMDQDFVFIPPKLKQFWRYPRRQTWLGSGDCWESVQEYYFKYPRRFLFHLANTVKMFRNFIWGDAVVQERIQRNGSAKPSFAQCLNIMFLRKRQIYNVSPNLDHQSSGMDNSSPFASWGINRDLSASFPYKKSQLNPNKPSLLQNQDVMQPVKMLSPVHLQRFKGGFIDVPNVLNLLRSRVFDGLSI